MEEDRNITECIERIVALEWKQFQAVHNEGGRASCQDDYKTFEIMRKSQFLAWDEEVVRSYLTDIEEAEERSWNLLTEKYARMMESTAPEQYAALSEHLPKRSEERIAVQEEIVRKRVEWEEVFAKEYPGLAGTGRSIHTSEDTPYNTSFETYARGELGTYSDRTVALYLAMIRRMEKDGENLSGKTLEYMVSFYGFSSIEEAEKRHSRRSSMKLYLTSSPTGSYREDAPTYQGLNPENHLAENLKRDWKEDSKCLVISASPDAYMENNAMRFFFEKKLKETGLSVSGVDLLDRRNAKETVDKLLSYDMIILGGGHVPTQNTFFHRIGLIPVIQKFDGIVMGISAGTMNCAKTVYAQPEIPGESVSKVYKRFIEGLGLTQHNVLPHYQAVKDDILDEKRLMEDITYPDSMGKRFYALPDGSYILEKEGEAWIYGEAYLISDGKIEKICEAGGICKI